MIFALLLHSVLPPKMLGMQILHLLIMILLYMKEGNIIILVVWHYALQVLLIRE